MKRRLLNLLTVVSFLLCAACCMTWLLEFHLAVDLAPSGSWNQKPEKRFFGLLVYEPAGNTEMALVCVSPNAFGLLALIFGLLPLPHCWQMHKRSMWLQRGHCINCGYDLRASNDRCPECGEASMSHA